MEITIELLRNQKFETDEDTGKEAMVIGGNGDIFVEPLGQKCRGRLVKANQPRDQAEGKAFSLLPEVLVGYHVSIDIRARKVKVYDPLYGTQKGEDLVRRFEGIGVSLRLKKPVEQNGLGEQQLWLWIKWMFRAARNGMAEVISGKFPDVVEQRVDQERQWDLEWYPDSGKRKHWEPEPSLTDEGPAPKPSKAA